MSALGITVSNACEGHGPVLQSLACPGCGEMPGPGHELRAPIGPSESVCLRCFFVRLHAPWAAAYPKSEAQAIAAVHAAEVKAREAMQRRGGADAYRVRAGKS